MELSNSGNLKTYKNCKRKSCDLRELMPLLLWRIANDVTIICNTLHRENWFSTLLTTLFTSSFIWYFGKQSVFWISQTRGVANGRKYFNNRAEHLMYQVCSWNFSSTRQVSNYFNCSSVIAFVIKIYLL